MSKPISFGFGKPKAKGPVAQSAIPKQIALSTDLEREDEDEPTPRAEIITGFDIDADNTRSGKDNSTNNVRVIENAGNADWRTRGQRRDGINTGVVLVEKNEVSTASGLQFATPTGAGITSVSTSIVSKASTAQPQLQTVVEGLGAAGADAEAISALLADGNRSRLSSAIIASSNNPDSTTTLGTATRSQSDDLQADLSSRPDSSTLADYTAMPVEEFGLALVRGMGKKRRANGEIIIVEPTKEDEPKKARKQEGFLGIGARPVPGAAKGVELGAWGKADMKKNSRGEGFFTPVMVRLANGETMTEEELERRKAEAAAAASTTKQRDRKEGRNGHEYRHDGAGSEREVTSRRRRRSRSRDSSRDRGHTGREERHSTTTSSKDRNRYGRSRNDYSRGESGYRDRERDGEYTRDRNGRKRSRSPRKYDSRR